MWTYPTINFTTGAVVSEHVPFTGVSFSNHLRDGGAFTGTCEVDLPYLSGDMRNVAIRLVTFPCKNGVPFGAYTWMSGPAVALDSTVQKISMERYDKVLMRRPIMDDLVFTGKEQVDIARDLVRYGTGLPTQYTDTPVYPDASWAAYAQIPWLRLAGGNSAVYRDRTKVVNGQDDDGYRRKNHKPVGQALQQLADLQNGFEFRWDVGRDSSGLYALLSFGYPIIGAYPDMAARINFEYPGGNVVDGSYGWDATDYANRSEQVGGDAQGSATVGTASNTAALVAGYPLRVNTTQQSNVADQTNLTDKATADVAVTSVVKDSYSLKLSGDKEPVLGTYVIGDHVMVRIRRGGRTDLDERIMRLTGWTIDVDDSGMSETVTPVLAARAW